MLTPLAFAACAPDEEAANDRIIAPIVDAGWPPAIPGTPDADVANPPPVSALPDAALPPGPDYDGALGPAEAGAIHDAGGVGDAGVTPPATSCTGKPGARRGKVQAMVMAGGLMRTFIYYAPPSLDAQKAAPLVISPHGFTMSGEDMYALTGFKELADAEGFVAIFPDGGGFAPWNVGEGINGLGAAVGASHDDQSFVAAMIKYAEEDRCIDKEHVFVSGFSMGGYFSTEVACLRSDIAGVAPHAGGSHDLSACPGSLKPVIMFHGTDDLVIFYPDGQETRDRWVKRNGCATEFEMKPIKGGSCEFYKSCMPGAQVAFCTLNGMGHAVAGGNPHLFSDQNYEDAARYAWNFWKQYAW